MQNAAVSLSAPPSNVTSIHALKSVLTTAGQHLGDLVWWTRVQIGPVPVHAASASSGDEPRGSW